MPLFWGSSILCKYVTEKLLENDNNNEIAYERDMK